MKFSIFVIRVKKLVAILSIITLTACVGSSSFPESSAQVNFNGPEGKTGWSKYEQNAFFRNVSKQEVYDAAKDALGVNGFALLRADINSGIVLGEHGMTLHDWNVVTAIYFVDEPYGVRVRVQSEGSKDLGFSGDVTGGGWTGLVISFMRNRLGR